MLARVRTVDRELDSVLVIQRSPNDTWFDQALNVASLAERLTKRISVAALALAIPLHLYVDPAGGTTIAVVAVLAFTASLVCARRWPRTPTVVTAAAAVVPVVLAALIHTAALNIFYTVILAALFAALLPTLDFNGWQLPSTWKLPIGIWALTLSLGWPVMILREAGLRLGTLRDIGALDSWALLTTPQVESWILYVVITQLAGVLWLDWICHAGFGSRDSGLESDPGSRISDPILGLWI